MLRRRISKLKEAAFPVADFEARRVAVSGIAAHMVGANEAATSAGLSPMHSLELFAVSAMGFSPGIDEAATRNAFAHTIRYLHQICDRSFLGETPYALILLHAADFGDRVRTAFPDVDFGNSLLDGAEVTMSSLDDLVFQCPLYALAVLPHMCDFIAPSLWGPVHGVDQPPG
jgi:hypothetical protein